MDNLRRYPSTQAASLTRIPLGEWVFINCGFNQNVFLSVTYNGMNGYALSAYIEYIKE